MHIIGKQKTVVVNPENIARMASDLLCLGDIVPAHIAIHWLASYRLNSGKTNDTFFAYFQSFLSRYRLILSWSKYVVNNPWKV